MKYTKKQLDKKFGGKEIYLLISKVPRWNWGGDEEVFEVGKTSRVLRENYNSLDMLERRGFFG